MIKEERVEKALKYLVETDEEAARAKALLIGLEEQKKTVKGMGYLDAEGTVGERTAESESSQAYRDHIKKIEDATYDFELLRNKRKTEELVIEVWRSENANRRRGNI